MNKPDMYMPLILGDFFKDTTRLDAEQQGMYLLLMIEFWLRGPIPNDPKVLQKICKISAHVFQKKSAEVLEIFSEENGRLVHPNLMRERARSIALHKARSDGGHKGNQKRWAKSESLSDRSATENQKAEGSHSYSYSDRDTNSLSRAC